MKIITTILLVSMNAFGQVPLTYTDGQGQFQKVVEAAGKPVDELYKSTLKWISVSYKNPER